MYHATSTSKEVKSIYDRVSWHEFYCMKHQATRGNNSVLYKNTNWPLVIICSILLLSTNAAQYKLVDNVSTVVKNIYWRKTKGFEFEVKQRHSFQPKIPGLFSFSKERTELTCNDNDNRLARRNVHQSNKA